MMIAPEMQDGQSQSLSGSQFSGFLFFALFVVVLLSVIILLNLTISVVNEVWDTISGSVELIITSNQANLIIEHMDYYSDKGLEQLQKQTSFLHVLELVKPTLPSPEHIRLLESIGEKQSRLEELLGSSPKPHSGGSSRGGPAQGTRKPLEEREKTLARSQQELAEQLNEVKKLVASQTQFAKELKEKETKLAVSQRELDASLESFQRKLDSFASPHQAHQTTPPPPPHSSRSAMLPEHEQSDEASELGRPPFAGAVKQVIAAVKQDTAGLQPQATGI